MSQQESLEQSHKRDRCAATDCKAVVRKPGEHCLEHMDEPARERFLGTIIPGAALDLSGTSISADLLKRIIERLRPKGNAPPLFGNVRFDEVVFIGDVSFRGAQFTGDASFKGAKIVGEAWFHDAIFTGETVFPETFAGLTSFSGAQFKKRASFSSRTFSKLVDFIEAEFVEEAAFGGTNFAEGVTFMKTRFMKGARFDRAKFGWDARFDFAEFHSHVTFNHAEFATDAWLPRLQSNGDISFVGSRFGKQVYFDESEFHGAIRFDSAQFHDHARFYRALCKDARFDRARFVGTALFTDARFGGWAAFFAAQFEGDAFFHNVEFNVKGLFHDATFHGQADFHRAKFGEAGFDTVTFSGSTSFQEAQFNLANFHEAVFKSSVVYTDAKFGNADFRSARFGDFTNFTGARFSDSADFSNATLPDKCTFSRVTITGKSLLFNNVSLEQFLDIEVRAERFDCVRSRLKGGGNVRLFGSTVDLSDSDFPNPFLITAHVNENGSDPRASLLSLRNSNLNGLVLNNLSLARCRFDQAHNLDKLRIERCLFADTPHGWKFGRVGGQGLPIWRWTRRQSLAEEHEWRAARPLPSAPNGRTHPKRADWYEVAVRPTPEWLDSQSDGQTQPLAPRQIASLYRSLRKAREDNKDEPGAADFYYGEMEMRRLDPQAALGERFILWLYWLVSGYSLRGLRSLACLTIVVAGLGILLQSIGFNGRDPLLRDALVYAAQTTLSMPVSRALAEHASWAGEMLRVILRLTGPILLGLALLSVRNRVKR